MRGPRPGWKIPLDGIDVAQARVWMKAGRKIAITYRDSQDRPTRRIVWPVVIGYLEAARMIVGWCELRGDFRSFRVDRVAEAEFLEERYPERPAVLRAKWLARVRERPAPSE